jgi:hypothetical protein
MTTYLFCPDREQRIDLAICKQKACKKFEKCLKESNKTEIADKAVKLIMKGVKDEDDNS